MGIENVFDIASELLDLGFDIASIKNNVEDPEVEQEKALRRKKSRDMAFSVAKSEKSIFDV